MAQRTNHAYNLKSCSELKERIASSQTHQEAAEIDKKER